MTGQRVALRVQLLFHKFVLLQNADKQLYYLTSGGRNLPIAKLVADLKEVIGMAPNAQPTTDVAES